MTFRTIQDDGPWIYLNVLNECIKVLLTVGIGVVIGYFKILKAEIFIPHATKFVFYVALPLLVMKGLGVGVNFYDDDFLWNFISAFLILRVIALVVSFTLVVRSKDYQNGIGQVAVTWLTLTWISTVILGIPISGAVLDAKKGQTYGILAGISSFIFQLPLQLLFLECHTLETEHLAARKQRKSDIEGQIVPEDAEGTWANESEKPPETSPPAQETAKTPELEETALPMAEPTFQKTSLKVPVVAPSQDEPYEPLAMWLKFAQRGDVWKRILIQIIHNPVLWGIAGGFALSLSTVGPRFLNPTSKDFVPGLLWFVTTTGWLGDCVSPVALFSMGVWMQAQGNQLFRISFFSATLWMISKLILVPLLMVGLAKAVHLNNEAGRVAVLIASLPISLASFSLASRYDIGQAVLSANVALGTALMLPTILVWNVVMDALDLFPIDHVVSVLPQQ